MQHNLSFYPWATKNFAVIFSLWKKIYLINFMTRPWVLAQFMPIWNPKRRRLSHWWCNLCIGHLMLNKEQSLLLRIFRQETENAGRKDPFFNRDLFCFESENKLRLADVQLFWPVLRWGWHSANSRFDCQWTSLQTITSKCTKSVLHSAIYLLSSRPQLNTQQCTWSILTFTFSRFFLFTFELVFSNNGQRRLKKDGTESFKVVSVWKEVRFDGGDLCMRAEARDVTGPGPLAGSQASAAAAAAAAEALED